jgi:hypothetical protein
VIFSGSSAGRSGSVHLSDGVVGATTSSARSLGATSLTDPKVALRGYDKTMQKAFPALPKLSHSNRSLGGKLVSIRLSSRY